MEAFADQKMSGLVRLRSFAAVDVLQLAIVAGHFEEPAGAFEKAITLWGYPAGSFHRGGNGGGVRVVPIAGLEEQ